MINVQKARNVLEYLGNVRNKYSPPRNAGIASRTGKYFLGSSGRLMKISNLTNNSITEMNVAKKASNAGVGLRVYNTRRVKTPNGRSYAVILLNSIPPGARFLKNVLNTKYININNVNAFKRKVQSSVNALHWHGIHHGNLRKNAILILNNKAIILNYGRAKYNKKIVNGPTSRQYAGGSNWMGRPKPLGNRRYNNNAIRNMFR